MERRNEKSPGDFYLRSNVVLRLDPIEKTGFVNQDFSTNPHDNIVFFHAVGYLVKDHASQAGWAECLVLFTELVYGKKMQGCLLILLLSKGGRVICFLLTHHINHH